MTIRRVGVVGFGLMGSGIAQVCAQAGYETIVREVAQPLLDKGFARVDSSLARIVKAAKLTEDDAKAARGRMHGTTALEDLKDCDLVIEAVIEEMTAKQQVFGTLDGLCPAGTIFASNTSSLTIIEMAATTKRADRFAGLHFFNPAPVMPLVEIVRAITTSEATVATLREFVASLGKTGVVCKDTPGFIVNRLMVPYLLGAIRALEQGIASVEEIDTAVKLGLSYRMGPFELLDYTGLDINLHVANSFYDEFKDPSMAPPMLLKRMVLAGHLGTKVGRGFYEYDEKGQKKK
ncbi:MAG: 3-hydroxyacyl-CoA dehydrogenase family protein [Chloroflexota bacterium]